MLHSLKKTLFLKMIFFIYFVCIVVSAQKKDKEESTSNKKTDEGVETTERTLQEVLKETVDELEKDEEKGETVVTGKDLEKIEELATEAAAILSKDEKEFEEKLDKIEEKIEEEEESASEEAVSEKEEETASKPEESDESVEKTSAPSVLVTVTTIDKEEAPEGTFAVWNSKGKICLLAKFHAVFSITYASKGGEQKAEISVPEKSNMKGKCGSSSQTPLLQISWQRYTVSMMFNKSDEENWIMSSLELTYDTSDPLFDGAANAGKKTARSKDLKLFETSLGSSYFCPALEMVRLYAGNKQVVSAYLRSIHIQPYAVEDGQFSQASRCSQVVLDDIPYVQDETVPLAVGLTLALIVLFILVGFSVHRAYNAAKVDYNSMP